MRRASGLAGWQPRSVYADLQKLVENFGSVPTTRTALDKFRAKAEDLADAATPPDLRDLLLYLVDSVLDGSSHVVPEAPAESSGGLVSLPVA